jgi:hypothetical protein
MLTTVFGCPLSHKSNGTNVHRCFDQMSDTMSMVTGKTEISDLSYAAAKPHIRTNTLFHKLSGKYKLCTI